MDRGYGEREVAFYRTVSDGERPLVRCWDAAYDPRDGSSHLLLEDVGTTHIQAVMRNDVFAGRGVPPSTILEGVVAALGEFHARRWNDPRIGESFSLEVRPWFADDASIEAHIERRRGEMTALDGPSNGFRYTSAA